MHIRRAKARDAEAISLLACKLNAKCIADEFTPEGRAALLGSMTTEGIGNYLAAGLRYHVVESNGSIVGIVGMRDNRHLYHLFVKEEFQGRGIARKLWQVARDLCLAEGNPGLFTVNASRRARPLYEKLGFVARSGLMERNGVLSISMELNVRTAQWNDGHPFPLGRRWQGP